MFGRDQTCLYIEYANVFIKGGPILLNYNGNVQENNKTSDVSYYLINGK